MHEIIKALILVLGLLQVVGIVKMNLASWFTDDIALADWCNLNDIPIINAPQRCGTSVAMKDT